MQSQGRYTGGVGETAADRGHSPGARTLNSSGTERQVDLRGTWAFEPAGQRACCPPRASDTGLFCRLPPLLRVLLPSRLSLVRLAEATASLLPSSSSLPTPQPLACGESEAL